MRVVVWCALICVGVLTLAACGGKKEEGEGEHSEEAQAACTAPELTAAAKLPTGWPKIEAATYTKQETEGPTNVVEGHFAGEVKDAHDEYKKELQAAGFTILSDELEEDDSEVNWKGGGRSGQVAIRAECGSEDKMYVRITNRPA
ncbi:MAG TPA: hypothetical protein VLU96_13270 [Gaiellaceae bacterium]|nr:hypothetical protein [Gaiellaceae bacterium]